MGKGALGLLSAYWPEMTARHAHVPLERAPQFTVHRSAKSDPDRAALITPERSVTFAELSDLVRRAGAGIQHRNVLIKPRHECACLAFVVLVVPQRVAPGSEVIPPRAPRSFRVRRNDAYAFPGEVSPIPDVLGVAFANQEHDRRHIGRAVVGQSFLPIRRQPVRAPSNSVDIVSQRQCNDVGFEPEANGARLCSRTGV